MYSQLEPKQKSSILMHMSACIVSLAGCFLLIFLVLQTLYDRWPVQPTYLAVDPYEHHYNTYLKEFGKTCRDEEEYRQRLNNFKNSLKEIETMNSVPDRTANYGCNKFSDMSAAEFGAAMTLPPRSFESSCKFYDKICEEDDVQTSDNDTWIRNNELADIVASNNSMDIPEKFDWRDSGVVGPVLDQHWCLTCWAFSVVGVMESMLLISGQASKYTPLSIQELNDCSRTSGFTRGCYGGSDAEALRFLCYSQDPIALAKQYPLQLQDQDCLLVPSVGVIISSFHTLCDVSSDVIAALVARHGPITVAVNSIPWRNYLDGVISYHCSDDWNDMNHVVQIVGYDKAAEVPHFILRNSWGEDFGERGYVRVAMNGFVCGIGRQISYLNVKKVGLQ